MENIGQIHAEIKDRKLIINEQEVNLKGIYNLVNQADMLDFTDAIDDIFYSYAKLCAILSSIDDKEQFSLVMPAEQSIFMIRVIRDSLRDM